jgi:hypothetical protein
MTPTLNVVFVPYPVGNGLGWEKRAKPAFPYPREDRGRWPLQPTIPVRVRDERQVRDLLADAKRLIAEQRAARLLRELE